MNVYGDESEGSTYTDEQLMFELANNGYTDYSISDSIDCSSSTGTIIINDSSDSGVACPSTTDSPDDVLIENINIQKWVNVVITFNNRTLDVYINGKLVKSKPFKNIIVNGNGYEDDILITPDDGFGGFISKVQYFRISLLLQKHGQYIEEDLAMRFESALNKYNFVSFIL